MPRSTELDAECQCDAAQYERYAAGANTEAILGKLDLDDRRRLLALPPHVREQIIQGMREEGPEAYRKFIQGCFQQLKELPQKK